MSIATQPPPIDFAEIDDPDLPGRYMTDGNHLFRLMGPGQVRNGYIEIEDCGTLEVWLVDSRELRSWGLSAVCRHDMPIAA